MPIFPREKLPTVTVPMKPAYTKPGNEPPAKTLVLTTSYFASEKNPKHAFQEACEQQGAHFNEPAFYYRKACILIQLKSYSRAEQELKNLIADIPNNSDYHLARAFCYYKMKNKTAADDEINTARFHNPRLPENIEIGNE
jgi:predicted Zn-dependent protease